jgi:hypothetical protein
VVRRFAGDDPRHVVVIGGLEAPRRWARGRRRARDAGAGGSDVGSVEVTRATVIGAEALIGGDAAAAWLERAAGEEAEGLVTAALAVLNEALHDFRVATADPYLVEVLPERALVTRIGYGSGDQVAEGRWEEARELPPPRPRIRREAALRPQERLAALLSGRDVALACEELALRARLDLDQGRDREAAMQLHLALEAGLAELQSWRNLPGMAERLAELAERREAVAVVREAALQGGLDEEAHATVESALARLEAALRARTAAASF